MIFLNAFMKNQIYKLISYLFYSRTCVFQLLYLFLVTTFHAIPIHLGLVAVRIEDPHSYHLTIPLILCLINFIFFILSCYSDPGVINSQNISQLGRHHKHDGVIFMPGYKCVTCNLSKIPRSKHCRVLNKCIFKFDHYCVWVANCIGGNNHRYFLLFLTTLLIMVTNGIHALHKVLRSLSALTKIWLHVQLKTSFQSSKDLWRDVLARYFVYFKVLIFQYTLLVSMLAGCLVLALVISGFLCFSCYQVLKNQTTNERMKVWKFKNDFKNLLSQEEKALHSKVIDEVTKGTFYSRGVVANIVEDLFPNTEWDGGSRGYSCEVLSSPLWNLLQSRKEGHKLD